MVGTAWVERCQSWWRKLFWRKLRGKTKEPAHLVINETSGVPSTLTCVQLAHHEWLAAREYFESISEPELVEHAVHTLLAAEKRYEFLLRTAKDEGITVPPVPPSREGGAGYG